MIFFSAATAASLSQRVFLECAVPQNSCDHLKALALEQLPADSLSAWPTEVVSTESTVAADVTPVLSSGHKKYGAQANERAL